MALSRKARESVNTLEHILQGVDGVTWEWQQRKRHLMLRIRANKQVSTITVSMTASDARARMNQVGDVKRGLRKMGVSV